MTNEIIYIVGSDLETSSFYAEFDNEAKAIDFAKKNLDKLPFVQKVVTEYDDLGNENFVDYIDIWDHAMEDTAVTETEEDYWNMMAAQFEEEEKNKYDAGDTTWFESVDTNDLVEAMEENEDMVECKECFELFPKVDGIKLDIGYICPTCADAGKLVLVSDEDTFKVDFPEYEKFRDTEDEFDDSKLAMSDEDVTRVNEPFKGNDEPELTPEEAVPFLVKDEEEAIAGYEKAAEVIETSDVENKEEILDTLDHIKEEEEEHIEELTDLVDDEIIEVENDPISDEEEIETIEDPESAVLNEDTASETKYWMCWYDGNDAAVVEAATEEEAEWTFMEDYKDEYFFDSWDHDWSVEEISKEEYDEWEESHSLFARLNLSEHINEEHPAIESDQELKGTDNAVVDCKVAKVIAHSEDEKPVDCEGKKKPLEKPLTEGFAGKLSSEADEVNLIEFNKLCKEIGITTVSELDRFIKDESSRPGTLLDKLKSYRAELGDDFKVKDESLNEGIFSSAIKFQIRLRADDYLNNISQRLAKSLNGELVSESKRALTIEVTKTNIDSIKTVSGLTKYVDYVKSSISTAILTYNKANKSDSIDSVTLNISLSVDASLFKKGKARDAQNMSLYKCELAIPKDSTGYINRGYTAITVSSKKFKVYDEDSKIEQVSKVLRSIFESVDGVSNSETLKETFTKEEQEEYNMDEYGVSLDGYDEYVRCTWCGEIFTKDSCVFEANLGWLCDRCYQAILSRGEKLTIINNPTDEDIARTLTEEVKMTAKELKDKFGTDDVDLINAGREPEERVELTEDADEIKLTSDPAEKNPGENVKMANTSSTSGMDFEEACKKFGIELQEAVGEEIKMPFSDLSKEEQDYIKDFTKFINDAIKNKTEVTADDILKFKDNYSKNIK
jgi:formylmethanofuran dehydrogenase subunit E